jgi:predicted transposase/invertase (TIGR01784 family)
MSAQSNPHDSVFRRILGEPANAASQLRAVLPRALTDRLDLDRLTPVPGSFVDPGLQWRHSDLLFTAPMQGRDALIYVLIEHQSSEDPLMPMRMLRYMLRIWEQYLGGRTNVTRLPAVIPLVVHHNRRAWAGSTQMRDLFDLDPALAGVMEKYLPRFRFLLDDLTMIDEEALRARPVTAPVRITLLLLKIANGNPDLAADLARWLGDLRVVLTQPNGVDTFVTLLRYIEVVGESPPEELRKLVAQLGPEAEEAYMTTAEMLRAEGEARALVRVLTVKFGPLPQSAIDTVNTASAAELEAWMVRVLTAETLDDVLA